MAWIALILLVGIVWLFNNYGMVSFDTWRWLCPVLFVVTALLIVTTCARCCMKDGYGKKECCGKGSCSTEGKDCKCGGTGPCQCPPKVEETKK